jgi:hypothetical protein
MQDGGIRGDEELQGIEDLGIIIAVVRLPVLPFLGDGVLLRP